MHIEELKLYIENTQYLSMWAPKVDQNTNKENLGAKHREAAVRCFKDAGYVSYLAFWPIVSEAKKMYKKEIGFDETEKDFPEESVSFMTKSDMQSLCKELAAEAAEKLKVEGCDDW